MPAKRKKRRGIFGMTGSPVTYGHLICAESAADAFDLDSVEFAISANPPNKPFGVLDAEDRYEMAVAATEDNPRFNASRVDIEHVGTGYSLLTVEAIKRQYGKDELFYLSSAEYLDPSHRWYLPKWIGGRELLKLCTFVVFPRDLQDAAQARSWAEAIPGAKIEVIDAPSPPLSSTLVRDLVAAGKSIWYTTPWPVQQMIHKKGYYRTPETPVARHEPVPPEKVRRIAIFGGQFDPITYRDLLAAEWIRQEYSHDRVLFVPSGRPLGAPDLADSAESRYRMVVAATAENPYFDVCRLDVDRNTNSYALLTVEDVRRKFGDHIELDLLVCSKYLDPEHEWYLPRWMGSEELFRLVRFIVVPKDRTDIEPAKQRAKAIAGARIEVAENVPLLPVTSSYVRDRVRQDLSIRYTTPVVVQEAIRKLGLYRGENERKRRRSR